MTQVYRNPDAERGLRVLLVGAGAYPQAKVAREGVPRLKGLTSVAPTIMAFARRLLVDWRADLSMDLVSLDLLLSDPRQPQGVSWPGFGVEGEISKDAAVKPPTLANLDAALQSVLTGAMAEDGLLLLFCGHGVSRASRYFIPGDFGHGGDPWRSVVDLDGLALALRQVPPRTQWLFWDCCADIPGEILDALGQVGTPLIQPLASKIAAAKDIHGTLSRFGIASSPLGEQAFGIQDQPSRFAEMLMEAIEGTGAVKRQGGTWWVDDRGIVDALQSYARRRHPELADPGFYAFVMPFSSDAPQRIRFRQLRNPPASVLIATSSPHRTALKNARVTISLEDAEEGDHVFSQEPPGSSAMLYVPLPPLRHYTVVAVLGEGQERQSHSVFADLPLAEDVEFLAR